MKVKRAAIASIGSLHEQIGPQFKALALSLAKSNQKSELEDCFQEHPFDATQQSEVWPKWSLATKSAALGGERDSANTIVSLAIPKSDLSVELEEDCISKLVSRCMTCLIPGTQDEIKSSNCSPFSLQGSKDGKASWKIRKEALDDVDAALKRCSGLLDVSGSRMKQVVALLRALRDRLTDTQINLKPLAARVIGVLLSTVDKSTQAKLGRMVFAPLINAAMNDIKKPMRDAALGALQAGTTLASLEGEGVNDEALEEFVTALVSEVNERATRVRL